MARYPGSTYRKPDFEPLLAVHRIKNITVTERSFELPKSYDFQKEFNHSFGLIKGKPFKVEVEFSGYAAAYVAERIWSTDQKVVKYKDGRIRLKFTASSRPEVVSWLMSFGKDARVIRPAIK